MNNQELLECIAPYLPYNVKGVSLFNGKKEGHVVFESKILDLRTVAFYMENSDHICFKPILRPLSNFVCHPELYRDIRDNMSEYEFESLNTSFVEFPCLNNLDHISYSTAVLLFKHHFDVFGLIGKGYAIDINTL